MGKHFSIFYFILLSTCISAQEMVTPVIKIYLEDAKTKQNISDSKVTLEGFELPSIRANYDKKKKYYYFTKIPSGYNTIMAYHKKYNEKGFQNNNQLPKELKLQLYNSLNVCYDFETEPFKNSYIEDPYKISISTVNYLGYNSSKDFINQTIKDLKLEIELVNPYWEMNKIEGNPFSTSQNESYPKINIKENQEVKGDFIFPLVGGVSTIFPDRVYSNKPKDICFILRKIDGSKFKRFNDPIIKKLKQQKFEVYSIILNKKNGTEFKTDFKIRDRQNKKFNLKNKADSSKVFFYDYGLRNKRKPLRLFNFFKKDYYLPFDEPNKYPQLPTFVLISNGKDETYNLFPETGKENPVIHKIPIPDDALGLGILDLYDYYSQLSTDIKGSAN
ncbi:hypothetical protein [uncultured Flavobacterium sp.]|uniref:hypothetical protein n=1 Tax=uncultured Flavobacterium sp. TaxID=165435 RepID=UPI00292E2596|nr:hypothetical protein [uncultured Flavobacterium sp.]